MPLKSLVVALACVAMTPAAGKQVPAAQTPTSGGCAISGVVTDATTGAPIAGASVLLINIRDATGQFQQIRIPDAITDAKGRFVFTGLSPAFSYEVAASRIGYSVGETAEQAPIKLTEGEWKRDAKIAMARVSSISGRVVDERGEPVVGTALRVFTRRLVAGHAYVLPGATASTDDRGVYRVSYLEPGRYYVGVLSVQATAPVSVVDGDRQLALGGLIVRGAGAPISSVSTARGASVDGDGKHRLVLTNFATPPPPGSTGTRAYPPVFYPNARTIADAEAIEIAPSGSATNIDFQLSPVASSTVSGRVSGATQNSADMVLRLMMPGAEHLTSGSEVATTVEPDGTFTFLNVPRGDYIITGASIIADLNAGQYGLGKLPPNVGQGPMQMYSMMYDSAPNIGVQWLQTRGGSTAWARTPIAVSADVTNVDVALHETASANGHVVADDSSQIGDREQFAVSLEPANADPAVGVLLNSTKGDDHQFSTTGLRPTRYVIRVGPGFRGWRVTSIVSHGIDLTDSGIDASSGHNFDDIVVTVTKSTATLSGTVRDRTGAPAAASVILFPVDPKAWVDYGFTPDRVQSTNADSRGGYRLPSRAGFWSPIGDGDYFVIAVPVSQARAWVDPRFFPAAMARASRVTLSATAPKTLDLTVTEVVLK